MQWIGHGQDGHQADQHRDGGLAVRELFRRHAEAVLPHEQLQEIGTSAMPGQAAVAAATLQARCGVAISKVACRKPEYHTDHGREK